MVDWVWVAAELEVVWCFLSSLQLSSQLANGDVLLRVLQRER